MAKKGVSHTDLWHFSEYFHGNGENKPKCPAKTCQHFNRLSLGGYALEDERHLLIFRHFERWESIQSRNKMHSIGTNCLIN